MERVGQNMSLIVKRARTLERLTLVDIEVHDGKVAKIGRNMKGGADEEIDADGRLVLPTFVEPHVHLDKALLAEKGLEGRTIAEARQLVREAKNQFTINDIKVRAEKCVEWALLNGVTVLRTQADIDGTVELKCIRALLELKKKYQGLLDMQVVAFPQEGLVKEKGVYELMNKAIEEGSSVVGGIPESEHTEEDGKRHIDLLFELARKRNLDLDVHCDVVPYTKTIQYYAEQVVKRGYKGRATADHLIALSYYDDYDASRIIELLRMAEMNVVVNPCTMIFSGVLDSPPKGRGVTRIRELVEAGLNVSYGLDNVVDPYNPYGQFDPMRNGWLLAYQGFLNLRSHMEEILRMCTYNAAKILKLRDYGLAIGRSADFNVMDATTPREALRGRTIPLWVVKHGSVIVRNKLESERSF